MSARDWLAKVTSIAFPRSFAVGTPPMAKDYPNLEAHLTACTEYAAKEHHVCFTAQITDGTKHAIGREVEVQIPAAEAMKLGQQMVRVATYLRPALREGEQTPPTEGDRMT